MCSQLFFSLLISGINSPGYSSSSSFSSVDSSAIRFNTSSSISPKSFSFSDNRDSGFSSLSCSCPSSISKASSSRSGFSTPDLSLSCSSSISILCKYLVDFYILFKYWSSSISFIVVSN